MSTIILEGNRVSSNKMKNTGYNYQFDKAKEAIHDILTEDSGFGQ